MKLLYTIWKKWLVIGRVIGNFQSQVLFTFFYLVLFSPFGIVCTFFQDLLHTRSPRNKKKPSTFQKFEYTDTTIQQAQKQY